MNNLHNQLLEAIDRFYMQHYKRPTKIQLTSDFANYIAAKCPYAIMFTKDDSSRGYEQAIFSIPFEIDNTIDDDYKIIYEEN